MATSTLQGTRARRDFSTLVKNPEPQVERNPHANIWNVFQAQNNIQLSSGEIFQIVHQPDFRFPLIAWIYSITTVFTQTGFRDDAYASPPTILEYTLTLAYAMFFFIDAYLAPYISKDAQRILNQQEYQMFLENLLEAPVPDFAEEWFLKFQPFQDALATNLHVVSTLGTDDPNYDFGRIFPAISFLQLHNVLATSPANIPLPDLLKRFYTQIVCRFGNTDYTNGQLYGAAAMRGQSNVNRYRNWFNERIELLISNAAVRTTMSRVAYGTFSVNPPTYRDPDNYSVYDFVFGLSSTNLSQHMMLINHLRPFIRENFKGSKPLAFYLDYGKPDIVRHLSSGPFLPTWHTKAAPQPDFEGQFPLQAQGPVEFSAEIEFMVDKPDITAAYPNQNRLEQIAIPQAVPQGDQRNLLLMQQTRNANNPNEPEDVEPDTWTRFDINYHYQPHMLIFDPADSNPAAHGITVLGGSLIERSELCGIGINLPLPGANLLNANTLYTDGAVLRSRTRTAITAAFSTVTPAAINWDNLPLAFFLKSLSHIRIPWYRNGFVETSDNPAGRRARLLPAHRPFPPDTQAVKFTRRADDSYTAVASSLQRDSHISHNSVYLWSSYRVVIRDRKTMDDKVYYLPTLRHIYGQRVRTMDTHFPSLLIP